MEETYVNFFINNAEIILSGEGILHICEKDFKIKLNLIYDKKNEYYKFVGTTAEPIHNQLPISLEEYGEILLKNVILKYSSKKESIKNVILKKDILKDFFPLTRKEGKFFDFIFRKGYIELDMTNPFNNNYVSLGNFKISGNILGLTLDNGIVVKKILQREKEVAICKSDMPILEEDIYFITTALELFQGQYLNRIEEKMGNKIKFFLGEYKYNSIRTSTFLSDPLYCNDFVKYIYNFLKGLDDISKEKWKRAFGLIIAYNSVQNINGIVQLLLFFDIFKNFISNNSNQNLIVEIRSILTLNIKEDDKIKKIIKQCKDNITQKGIYLQTLKNEFLLPDSEAEFITNIRNSITHESLFLDESISKNLNNFNDNNSNLYSLLSRTSNSIIQAHIFSIYIEKIIYEYIFRKIPDLDSMSLGIPFISNRESKIKDFESIFEQLIGIR